jgi:hypothetical protein
MATAGVILILAAGAFFVGLLLYKVVGGALIVSRARTRARDDLAQTLASLSTEDLRRRLLQDPYLAGLEADAAVKTFLSRVAQGDEVALAQEYPRAKLYMMLTTAEANAGRHGRPEAVEATTELSGLLQELARRNR